ncbi:MAG: 16S rRNA (cytidine(1402)-2'-O)-methyltransferase [Chloroflexi bacterium]|nr:16S rRNA (cytidine(1402)-2'-O)-methyltransferase [Chloroflexota bacterium]
MPHLYVVATPIGNLEDVTLRALRILSEAKLIAAEDTRTTRKLLGRHGIKTPLVSFYEHNREARLPQILDTLRTGDVALVSEAGVPTLSDPGRELVRRALETGIRVVPVPGPSALTAAISVSGMPADAFTFLGFLPRRQGDRRKLLESVATSPQTVVIFEAPHRLRRALEDMLAVWGDRRITVCRELTKLYEEVFPGTISQALAYFTEPRGEFTLVVEGGTGEKEVWGEDRARDHLALMKKEGMRAKEAVAAVAKASGLPRRLVYQQWLALGKSSTATD